MPSSRAGPVAAGLQRRLGYAFADEALLRRALTHGSLAAGNNERLEFLGDAVLGAAVAVLLYGKSPDLPEGVMTRLRAALVNEACLSEVALSLELGGEIFFGKSALKGGDHRRPSVLADALEAVLGAVYLDGGFEALQQVVERHFGPRLDRGGTDRPKDSKTALQELLQGRGLPTPSYSVLEVAGVGNCQSTRVECRVDKLSIRSEGSGRNRRVAEQNAAAAALEHVASLHARRA